MRLLMLAYPTLCLRINRPVPPARSTTPTAAFAAFSIAFSAVL